MHDLPQLPPPNLEKQYLLTEIVFTALDIAEAKSCRAVSIFMVTGVGLDFST